ncbi:hypothetical protein ACS0TY_007169 [Phlomoides rotata]
MGFFVATFSSSAGWGFPLEAELTAGLLAIKLLLTRGGRNFGLSQIPLWQWQCWEWRRLPFHGASAGCGALYDRCGGR